MEEIRRRLKRRGKETSKLTIKYSDRDFFQLIWKTLMHHDERSMFCHLSVENR